MQIAGAIAQGVFGRLGSYAVSLLAGLVSSASAVASAAQLAAAGRITVPAAAVASVLASLASAGVNFVLVSRLAKSPTLIGKVG
jgi:uncharacterized membrane protein (DUF4010 family)